MEQLQSFTGACHTVRSVEQVSYGTCGGSATTRHLVPFPYTPPTPAWSKGLASVTCDKRWSMNIHKLVTGDRECFLKEELGSS